MVAILDHSWGGTYLWQILWSLVWVVASHPLLGLVWNDKALVSHSIPNFKMITLMISWISLIIAVTDLIITQWCLRLYLMNYCQIITITLTVIMSKVVILMIL